MTTETARLDAIFSALADPTRRAILAMLLEDDMAVTDVAGPFDMSLAAVSKHLAVLAGALGAGICFAGIGLGSFALFMAGSALTGIYMSAQGFYRFAATDTAPEAFEAKAISWVMVGGLAGAIIGPQLVIFTRDAVAGTPYVGSFLSQALLPLIALPILLMLRTPRQTPAEAAADSGRTVLQLLAMPRYALAVAAGVVSYGVMAFVMTAAPVAMVNHGHSVDNAALGIQWHLLAMFGPSFFTGRLMVRYGKERVTAVGMVLLATLFVLVSMGLSAVVGPARYNRAKYDSYECGIQPTPQPVGGGRFPVKYYITAMMFIVFDIEVVFLLPWAVAFNQLEWFTKIAMVIFIVLFFVPYFYVLRRKGLDWE